MSKSNSPGTTLASQFHRIYAICLVKNEDDVITQTLRHAAGYCEKIFVLDNGSTDRTWELVRSLSQVNPRVVPFAQTFEPFRESLRSIVYHEVGAELSEDDWWLILDADEFLAEDPQPIIRQTAREGADIIRTWQISFGFTKEDLRAWEEGRDSRDKPIFERRRYYRIDWQEKRLFPNRRDLSWGPTIVPASLKKTCTRRILIRHYPLRDPEQIQKRLLARFGHPTCFRRMTSPDWRHVVEDSQRLVFYRDGEPWHFTLSGLANYPMRRLVRRLKKKCVGVVRKVGRSIGGSRERGLSPGPMAAEHLMVTTDRSRYRPLVITGGESPIRLLIYKLEELGAPRRLGAADSDQDSAEAQANRQTDACGAVRHTS